MGEIIVERRHVWGSCCWLLLELGWEILEDCLYMISKSVVYPIERIILKKWRRNDNCWLCKRRAATDLGALRSQGYEKSPA